jgi:tetratricopeptide (TPR) repeat protein
MEQFNKALEIDDKADWIIADIGRAKKQKGDIEGAIESYTRAIEINNQRSVYYEWRAEAYNNLGKEDLAQKDKEIADDLHSKGLD